jgi:hypothetical protein
MLNVGRSKSSQPSAVQLVSVHATFHLFGKFLLIMYYYLHLGYSLLLPVLVYWK